MICIRMFRSVCTVLYCIQSVVHIVFYVVDSLLGGWLARCLHGRLDGFELNAERDAHLRDKRREVRREVVAVEGARIDAAS